MFRMPLASLRSVLLLGAHADDIEIGCGGTLLELQRQCPELSVGWVVFSGSPVRRDETQRSAEAFLGPDVQRSIVVDDFEDSFFPAQWAEIKRRFVELRERFQPQLILTHRCDDAHQDHRVVAELTWCTFRDHLIWEYEIPKYDGDLGRPNVFVPLTEEQIERKCRLTYDGFPSQQTRAWFDPETFRSLARIRGVEAAAESGFAEAFFARKLVF